MGVQLTVFPNVEYIAKPEHVLAMIGFGVALVTFALSVHRAARERATKMEQEFLAGEWEPDDHRFSRELRDLRSIMVLTHSVKIFGVAHFLALPAVIAAIVIPPTASVRAGAVLIIPRSLLGNFAVVLVAVAALWTAALYLPHRFVDQRLGTVNDDMVFLHYASWSLQVKWRRIGLLAAVLCLVAASVTICVAAGGLPNLRSWLVGR